jgi:hypothetical protein
MPIVLHRNSYIDESDGLSLSRTKIVEIKVDKHTSFSILVSFCKLFPKGDLNGYLYGTCNGYRNPDFSYKDA